MQGCQISSLWSRIGGVHHAVTIAGHTSQLGLSLIEAMIVTSITAILAAIAAPSFQGFHASRRLEGYAAELASDIQYVRSEAVARNKGVRISFGADTGGTCYILHTGDAGNCSCTSQGGAQCSDPNDLMIKTVGLDASLGVRLQANVASMLFEPGRGTTTPAGSLNFVMDNGISIRHVVNILGRTRTCAPQGSLIGYKPC